MSRVDVDAVDTSNFVGGVGLEVEGTEESTLVEIQSVNLMAGCSDDSVA